MKNTFKKLVAFLPVFILLTAIFLPVAMTPIAKAAVGIPDEYIKAAGTVPMKELLTTNDKNESKITGETGINYILQKVSNGLIYVAAPLAVAFVAHAGVSYTMAMGESAKLEAAKKELTWAIVGLFAILTAFFITRMMITFFFTATATPAT
ncbi:MAG: hypothetical protein UT33_C0021G0008 [Candidatus Peregrinibacteria bacterium GW2011_GWC2_39_14]|nr:MAG: hypothetical protein US92_C0013G0008 [Candidatus Peregrinibacteria bacterium GW2011_GWA2_38_36]KKR04372.1 MAG: hypothetical protein UT33_C0021G0008 [Candidatus Peregrinibacteria bacterium GW2011_GWC2_39_14]